MRIQALPYNALVTDQMNFASHKINPQAMRKAIK